MKRWLTTSNVLATVAMLCALTGTSITAVWAAPLLTGTNVRNSTLTGVDVKDLSLSSTDFTSAASTQLKAQTGPVGDKGPVGNTGSKGAKGRKGPAGVDAAKAYSFITAADTTSFVSPKTGSLENYDPVKGPCANAGTIAILAFAANCSPFAPEFPHWRYGNMELRLDRKLADKRVFPAINIAGGTGTRREEFLMEPGEAVLVWKLRNVLHQLEPPAALELLLSKLKDVPTNAQFLNAIGKNQAARQAVGNKG
jgi:hypothetical protein